MKKVLLFGALTFASLFLAVYASVMSGYWFDIAWTIALGLNAVSFGIALIEWEHDRAYRR